MWLTHNLLMWEGFSLTDYGHIYFQTCYTCDGFCKRMQKAWNHATERGRCHHSLAWPLSWRVDDFYIVESLSPHLWAGKKVVQICYPTINSPVNLTTLGTCMFQLILYRVPNQFVNLKNCICRIGRCNKLVVQMGCRLALSSSVEKSNKQKKKPKHSK